MRSKQIQQTTRPGVLFLSLLFWDYAIFSTYWVLGRRVVLERVIALHEITKLTYRGTLSTLNFETHHNEGDNIELSESKAKVFEPCSAKYIDYMPCHDQK
jgi:hypothetical protein